MLSDWRLYLIETCVVVDKVLEQKKFNLFFKLHRVATCFKVVVLSTLKKTSRRVFRKDTSWILARSTEYEPAIF